MVKGGCFEILFVRQSTVHAILASDTKKTGRISESYLDRPLSTVAELPELPISRKLNDAAGMLLLDRCLSQMLL